MTDNVTHKFDDIDLMPTGNVLEAMYEGQLMALTAIRPALNSIAQAIDAAAHILAIRGRLVYVGAGTSGRIAVQDGAELGPTFGWPDERLLFCMAGGMPALTKSAEGAEDSAQDGRTAIDLNIVNRQDIVIGVAASGTTPFTMGAMEQANELGALTIGIANSPDTPLLHEATHSILIETGNEIIAGSTRMKAGTTQKIVLNMISTAIMVKLGRVYKGMMVDMIVSNNKLDARAISMVGGISNCSKEASIEALTAANNNIKIATLIAQGQSLADSMLLLEKSNGNLRLALAQIGHE